MPVAHPDVDGQLVPAIAQPFEEQQRLPRRQLGERRDPVEELVVVRHFFDAFGGHAAAAQHVGQKRPHVVPPLRSAEGNDENGIERARHRLRL